MNKQILIERLLAIKSGVPITNIKLGFLDKSDLQKISEAADFLSKLPIYIDSNYYADMDYILSASKKFKRQKDIDIVILDYVQLMAERTDNMVYEIGRICRGFKLLSNDLAIGSILLSQLNRQVEMRDDKRPILSDLRQSGDLEQDADLVAMLYRDEYYNKETKLKGVMEFIIRKHRTGPLGDAFLKFVDDTNLIYEDK
jgi:replicative DNA helicase